MQLGRLGHVRQNMQRSGSGIFVTAAVESLTTFSKKLSRYSRGEQALILQREALNGCSGDVATEVSNLTSPYGIPEHKKLALYVDNAESDFSHPPGGLTAARKRGRPTDTGTILVDNEQGYCHPGGSYRRISRKCPSINANAPKGSMISGHGPLFLPALRQNHDRRQIYHEKWITYRRRSFKSGRSGLVFHKNCG